MAGSFAPTGTEYIRLLPEITLAVVATLVMVLEPLTAPRSKRALAHLSFLGLAAAMAGAVYAQQFPGPAFHNFISVDAYATFFRVLVIGAGMLVVLISQDYLWREGAESGEYYALVLFSIAGQCIMVASAELILMFIGLEISSIASYILAGYLRGDQRANEAAIKYFLLGSFATAFLLYGVALAYGTTGSTFLANIRAALSGTPLASASLLVGASASLMLVGLAFKLSIAPFQVWAPDVYQGAPSPVTAFLSAGPKAAAFAVFVRIFMGAFEPLARRWEPVLWLAALATMIVGNFAALTQSNLKRMLAYSSIAHAGYVLVAVTANSQPGVAAVLMYVAAYVFMNVGAFAVISWVSRKGEQFVEIEDLAGLSERQPATAALFSLFLLSLIGVPLTAGFFGKFYVFRAALNSRLIWLSVLGLLNSAVAAYYYLRVIVVMYMREPRDTTLDLPPQGLGLRLGLFACAAGTLVLGIFPGLIIPFVNRAAELGR